MCTSERIGNPDVGEREWRDAVVEVELARVEYAKHAEAGEEDSHAVGRRWVRLWRAERRRDDLIKNSD
jgi:hypothetical protein